MFDALDSQYLGLSQTEIENRLLATINERLSLIYGQDPHEEIIKRFKEEWVAMERSDTILDVAALHEFCLYLKKNKYPYYNRGTSGASFILWLLGITRGNPLPSHIYDAETKVVEFFAKLKSADYLDNNSFQENLIGDGYDLPWQVHWREASDYQPTFYVDLYVEFEEKLPIFLENHWLRKLRSEIKPYHNDSSFEFSNLAFVCIWKPSDFKDGFYENKIEINKLDFSLKNWQHIIDDFATELPRPLDFFELITAFGLSRSTGVYDETVKFMIEELGLYRHQIAFREDVFHYLVKHGYSKKEASIAMYKIAFGNKLNSYTLEMMQAVDSWILQRLDSVKYLFTRAHAVEFILFQLKRGVGDV